jgi:hypothetical protein
MSAAEPGESAVITANTGFQEPVGTDPIPVQAKIEAAMDTFQEQDRWETVVLFSSEGLPMASHGRSDAVGEADLLQFAFSLIEAVRLLGEDAPVREVTLRVGEKRNLSFHYFKAWGENLVLALVVSHKRGYRRALSRLIDYIQKLA